MTVILTLGLAVLIGVALAISGQLGRLADAVEAQNEHYGIGKPLERLLGISDEPVAGVPLDNRKEDA